MRLFMTGAFGVSKNADRVGDGDPPSPLRTAAPPLPKGGVGGDATEHGEWFASFSPPLGAQIGESRSSLGSVRRRSRWGTCADVSWWMLRRACPSGRRSSVALSPSPDAGCFEAILSVRTAARMWLSAVVETTLRMEDSGSGRADLPRRSPRGVDWGEGRDAS